MLSLVSLLVMVVSLSMLLETCETCLYLVSTSDEHFSSNTLP